MRQGASAIDGWSAALAEDYAQAVAQQRAGRTREAEALCRQVLSAAAGHAESWHLLGVIAQQTGRYTLAAESIAKAIALNAGVAEFHANLGLALQAQGDPSGAMVHYQRALVVKPELAPVWNILGNACCESGAIADAILYCERALHLSPYFHAALNNLGNALQAQGRVDAAISRYEQALSIKPDYALALSNLGNALKAQDQVDAAMARYEQALALEPQCAEVLLNLGALLADLGRLDDAVRRYEQALVIKPDFAAALAQLGGARRDLGQTDTARDCYHRALLLQPDALAYAFHGELALPTIAACAEAITTARQRYQEGMAALMLGCAGSAFSDPAQQLGIVSFQLAYHEADNRELMQGLCRLLRAKAPLLDYTAPQLRSWCAPTAAEGRRLRVGFCSQFLVTHTIGKLYQGLLRKLDRARFEVVLIHAPESKRDVFSAQLDALVDAVLVLPQGLRAQQQAVAALGLDVLFYPDIGMAPTTYYLAYARLAPVQAVGWGHPDTTGIDTLDYFVSCDSVEAQDAETQYSEQLIRLKRLPSYYQALAVPAAMPGRAALGLPATGTLYGCPQSLFKFHPDFDAQLAAIAAGDPGAHIVVLDGNFANWSQLLRARWAAHYPLLLERVVFQPRLALDGFMALLAQIDVLLDPIYFGSGNTLYEAMVYGTPIVTWPGPHLRGRVVAGAYAQMRIAAAPIAARLEDYAPLALALGRDAARRAVLRQALQRGARALFEDMRAVREFEEFLEAAVAAAGRGEKLSRAWLPRASTADTDAAAVP